MDPILLVALLIDNKELILATVTSVVTGASALAALTPTKKDDNVFSKILNLLAFNVGGAKPKESTGLILGVIKLLGSKK